MRTTYTYYPFPLPLNSNLPRRHNPHPDIQGPGGGVFQRYILRQISAIPRALNFKSGESQEWHTFLATLPSENRAWFESMRGSPLSPGDPNKVIEPVQHAIRQLRRAGLWTRSPARVVLSLDPRGNSGFAGEGTGHGALPRSASEGELVQSTYFPRQAS